MFDGSYLLGELGDALWSPISDDTYPQCETFVAALYGNFENMTDSDTVCLQVLDSQLPPTSNALRYHIQRAVYQVSIWQNALKPIVTIPSPKLHGWTQHGLPYLFDTSPANKLLTIACKCKRNGCQGNSCKCKKIVCHVLMHASGRRTTVIT